MRHWLLGTCLLAGIIGCNTARGPLTPIPATPTEAEAPSPDAALPDPLDEPFREGAGLLQGDIQLNGTTELDPNWDPSPFPITQPARAGDLVVFRVKGRLTNNASTTLFCKLSQTTRNYPSYFIPGTNTDVYRAIYVEKNEPFNLTFYNASNWNAPVNQKSAIFTYSFRTMALENADEPNDDDNGSTITDRELAKNIPLNFTATRSVFFVDNALKDVEEWYRTEVSAGTTFSWKFSTAPSRYSSSWSYTLRVFDPNGNQLGDPVEVGAADANKTITRQASTSGRHFLQIIANPISRSYTNVHYSLYTITPCFAPTIQSVNPTANSSMCPGSTATFNASIANGASSYAWNFGPGATPETSTSASPTVTLGMPGTYYGTLTVSNGCSSRQDYFEYQVGCAGGAGQQGGMGAQSQVVDMLVEPDGTTHLLTNFRGTIDADPGPGSSALATPASGWGTALVQLDPTGNLTNSGVITAESDSYLLSRSLAFSRDHNRYLVGGYFFGTADFDPTASTSFRTAPVDGAIFLAQWNGNLTHRHVALYEAVSSSLDLAIEPATGDALAVGLFSGTQDFDPGIGTYSLTSAGGTDAYLLRLNQDGVLRDALRWGGTSNDVATSIAVRNGYVGIGGMYVGTVDFDPGPGTWWRTAETQSGYYLMMTSNPSLTFYMMRSFGSSTGTATVQGLTFAGGFFPRLVGNYTGTVQFFSGPETVLTAQGAMDAWIAGLDSGGGFEWVRGLGGASGQVWPPFIAGHAASSTVLVGVEFQGTVDFDPGPGSDSRTSNGSFDIGALAISATGNRLFASTWGGTGGETVRGLGLDGYGGVRLGGSFDSATVDFDPGPGVTTLSRLGTYDAWFQRLRSDGTW